MTKVNKKVVIILGLIIVAVTTAAICYSLKENILDKKDQTFLASLFNNKESYDKIFSQLPKVEKIDAKSCVVSHHFLANELIANTYNQVSSNNVSTVYILSPDHYNTFFSEGVLGFTSLLPWHTPYGDLNANGEVIEGLLDDNIRTNDTAIALEHGIYVQMPFIKKFFPSAKIVPLILRNDASLEDLKSLGNKLKSDNSFLIISSDFSHNASINQALANDKKSIQYLDNLEGDINDVTNDCKQCLIVLSGFLNDDEYSFTLVDNKNSFDVSGEDKSSVTSYVFGYYSKKDYVQVLFTGDLMFDRGIRAVAEKNGNNFIFSKISNRLKNNDLVVSNLEGPITDNTSVSLGSVPQSPENYIFTFDKSLAETLFSENIRLVNLGNNHTLNFGSKGLISTKEYLDKANVEYFGNYVNRSIIKDIQGVKIAFVSYNENVADLEIEKNKVVDEIKNVKSQSDIVVVFSHWGSEYTKTAIERVEVIAHEFVNAGADLIVGSHPHVIQNVEEYKGKKIYYSLGNFVFDQYFSENTRNGLGVSVKIDKKTKEMQFEEIHFYLDKNGQTIEKY